jgi:hypothetical protein
MKFPTGITKHSFIVNLFEQHLAQALDGLWEVLGMKEDLSQDDFLIKWRLSSTCILHSFHAIDSLINFLAYAYFEDSDSDWYINPEDRKTITKRQLTKWHQLSFEKRLEIIWKEKEFDIIPPEVKLRIIELKNLRNWVAHGNPYTIIIEHEFIHVDDETVKGVTHATYPDLSRKTFESEEYKSPAYLTKEDAQKAVRCALESVVFILNQAKGFHVILKTFHGGKKEYWLDGNKPISEDLRDLGIGS